MYNAGQLSQISKRCFIAVGGGTTANPFLIPFTIPLEARFITFILGGAGAGGAGGVAGAITTSRRGGGGGSAGNITTGFFSTRLLPSTIFLQLPPGTAGGASGSSSTNAGVASITTIATTNTATQSTLLSATGGNGGNVSGAGGGLASAYTVGGVGVAAFARENAQGQAGSTSGVAVANTNLSASLLVTGGAAGGSTNLGTPFAGASIVPNGVVTYYQIGNANIVTGGANTGAAGGSGFETFSNCTYFRGGIAPAYSVGGAGGGAIDSGTGGNGGYGALGSGGGGGGAGTTGGRGGDGGSSFCIIEWW